MKRSNREKNLLIILVIVLVFYGYNQFVTKPLNNTIKEQDVELAQLKQKKDELIQNQNMNAEIEELLSEAKIRVKTLGAALPSQIHQEDVIKYISAIFIENNVNLNNSNYSIVPPKNGYFQTDISIPNVLTAYEKFLEGDTDSITEIKEFKLVNPNDSNKEVDLKQYNESKTGFLNIGLSFEANYEDFKQILNKLDSGAYNCFVKSISLSKMVNTLSDVTVNMQLSFPFYYDSEDLKDLEWELIAEDMGRYNPFLSTISNSVISNSENIVEPTSTDFYININTWLDDAPTVAIQKYPQNNSTIYGDENDSISVKMWFKKENNKYYYKYTVKETMYPVDGSYALFEPLEDNIVLKVNSSPRRNEQDLSGVNLEVYNESGLHFDIHTYQEGQINPRLEVIPHKGTFTLYKH